MYALWAVSPSCLANLGDDTGLLQDGEASTENLAPGVVLTRRVGGQSDWTESNQVWIPERDGKREQHKSCTILYQKNREQCEVESIETNCEVTWGGWLEWYVIKGKAPGITWLPPGCQQDKVLGFIPFSEGRCGYTIKSVFFVSFIDHLTFPAVARDMGVCWDTEVKQLQDIFFCLVNSRVIIR